MVEMPIAVFAILVFIVAFLMFIAGACYARGYRSYEIQRAREMRESANGVAEMRRRECEALRVKYEALRTAFDEVVVGVKRKPWNLETKG